MNDWFMQYSNFTYRMNVLTWNKDAIRNVNI
jgi:hypothetical protein